MKYARKDSNKYVLRVGEYERADGRYSYSYTYRGKRRTVYANTLQELRKKEKKIRMEFDRELNPGEAERITLNEMFDKYISLKESLKPTTKVHYTYTFNHFVRDTFGKRKIGSIRYSDVLAFYQELLKEGLKVNTLDNVHTVINSTLDLAVKDQLILLNPCQNAMRELKKSYKWPGGKREALERKEHDAFMNFIRTHHKWAGWVPIFTVLLGTGMRIGECVALRWEDVDMENRMIKVNLSFKNRDHGTGHAERHISDPKTKTGVRTIPMLDVVYEAFLFQQELQCCLGGCTEEIDGYKDFVFSNARGKVFSAPSINRVIDRILKDYNEEEEKLAEEENREPFLLPHFSAHILRHTFCTRMYECEVNLPVLASIMGHRYSGPAGVTVDVYTTISDEMKKRELAKVPRDII